jgi:hypothetical protein
VDSSGTANQYLNLISKQMKHEKPSISGIFSNHCLDDMTFIPENLNQGITSLNPMQTSRHDPHRPDYWHILNQSDQIKYHQLQHTIDPVAFRAIHVHTSIKLPLILAQIKDFAIRHDDDDWKRCLVCGIVWLTDAVAVSTRQLSLLIGKSKS